MLVLPVVWMSRPLSLCSLVRQKHVQFLKSAYQATWKWHILTWPLSPTDQEVSFKMDTGAEVTVISDKSLDSLSVIELQSSTKRLCGPDRRPLAVMGEFPASMSYKDRSCIQTVHNFKKLQQNLLGLPAIWA